MSDDVLDLGPALIAKRHRQCKHPHVLVSDTAAELDCAECGAPIDPWWFLRRLSHDEETMRKKFVDVHAKYDAEVKRLNGKLAELTLEVNALIDEKNRLWNLAVPGDGRPLGSVARRQVKRARKTVVGAAPPLVASGKLGEQG